MNRQFERYLQMSLVILDLSVLNILFFLCQALFRRSIPSTYFYAYLDYWILANIIWLLFSFFLRTYAEKIILNFEYFTKRTIQVYLVWIIFILVYLFFSSELTVSRPFIATTLGGFGLCLLVNRFIYLGIFKIF